jgi:hypothetical protein
MKINWREKHLSLCDLIKAFDAMVMKNVADDDVWEIYLVF